MGFVAKSSAASQNSDFVGAVRFFGNSSLPPGYLPCDGAAVSRVTYASLFSSIGTTFGAGDGSTTFNVPEVRGRVPMGDGTGPGLSARTLGGLHGTETHPLTIAELASHNHSVNDPGHVHDEKGTNRLDFQSGGGVHGQDVDNEGFAQFNTASSATGISVNNNGSGTAHPNVQPSTVFKYGIRYLDAAPTILSTPPTIQRFLSGSGTYNRPVSCRWIRVTVVGPGGGGASGGTGANNAGASGGSTTFGTSLLTASSGNGGTNGSTNTSNSTEGGNGGNTTVNSPAIAVVDVSGGKGGAGSAFNAVGVITATQGGNGGNNPMGGSAPGGYQASGKNANPNTGGGGGGGSANPIGTTVYAGGAGGAGGFIIAVIQNPLSSYSYSIGNGGLGGSPGTSGTSGGDGGSGMIIVEEFY